ncbi:thiamine phosphate synthase [Pelagibacteraceae bacterium]|nr:thiamine phosphate synthase [Pelagibacteraceae bacterium]|tara:strand:- start:120 stop:680 length:561 start_codon:yes stop_codon:yes gene_type:complete
MFIIKNNYYLYIENTQSIDLDRYKKNSKISFIYRNNNTESNLHKLKRFKKKCSNKNFKLYIANDFKLAIKCGADGLYLSSYNKKRCFVKKMDLIGSAHNFKEINEKQKQGCRTIILSRLFRTSYKNKESFLGNIRFNLIIKKYKTKIIALGGINKFNLIKLNLVFSDGLAILSAVKKKPVIANRLF